MNIVPSSDARDQIVHLTEMAFRENGPVHRVMGGKWRKEQYTAAVWHARFLQGEQPGIKAAAVDRALLGIAQCPAGTGKTLAISLTLAIMCLLTGRRGMISTYSISLRHDIAENQAKIDAILGDLANEANLPFKRQIKFAEYSSASEWPSLKTARAIAEDSKRDQWPEYEARKAKEYLEWVETGYASARENDRMPRLRDWLDYNDRLPSAPGHMAQRSSYAITSDELRATAPKSGDTQSYEDAAIAREFAARNASMLTPGSPLADILVITHAMFLNDGMRIERFDQQGNHIRGTRPTLYSARGDIEFVVIDEADLLHEMAENMGDIMLKIEDISKLIWQLGELGDRRKSNVAQKKLDDLLLYIAAQVRSDTTEIDTDEKQDATLLHVNGLFDAMHYAMKAVEEKDADAFEITEWYARVAKALHNIQSFLTHSGPRNRVNAQEALSVRLLVESERIDGEIFIKAFGTKPTRSSGAINLAWQFSKSRSYRRISFWSATIEGFSQNAARTVDFKRFQRLVGIWRNDILFESLRVKSTSHGAIDTLTVVDPKQWIELSPGLGTRVPTEGTRPNSSMTNHNPQHSQMLAQIATRLTEEGNGRTLFLFSSFLALQMAHDALPEHVRKKVILQTAGMSVAMLKAKFKQDPTAIWFGANWYGVNLVDDITNETMVKTIVVTKTPIPPPSPAKNAGRSTNAGEDDFDKGAAKLIQGIFRGIRSAKDRPDVWLCDPRMPVFDDLHDELRRMRISPVIPDTEQGNKNLWSKISQAVPEYLFRKAQINVVRSITPLTITK